MVDRGRGRLVFLVGGVQELMKTGGALAVVVAVSLDGADVAIVGRLGGVDRPLRHVI